MTGSTHVDLEMDFNVDSTTTGPDVSTENLNENVLSPNFPEIVGPPKIIGTKLISRNTLVSTS